MCQSSPDIGSSLWFYLSAEMVGIQAVLWSNAVVHLLASDIYTMSKFSAEFSSPTLTRIKT